MPPEAYAILLHADEMPDGGFEPPDADEGVEAGAVGPLVDDRSRSQATATMSLGRACTTMRRAMVPPVAMATCTP